jgi:hypothetical protein
MTDYVLDHRDRHSIDGMNMTISIQQSITCRQSSNVPQLFTIDSAAILMRTRLPTSYTTEVSNRNSKIRIKLAQYALNGSFMGFVNASGTV